MKKSPFIILSTASIIALTGCQGLSLDDAMSLGSQSFQAISLSDSEVKTLSNQSCAQLDAKSKIAPANSTYTQRLNKIAQSLGHDINGTKVNYKVYITPEVNAWAMANGCVRVYSGLMDKMTDNEIEGILGHELGHVALGHTKKRLQVTYATNIARSAAAKASNSTIASLSNSQIGDLAQTLVNSQFSQSQEMEADNFSYNYLKSRQINPNGIATAFDKLGGNSSLLSSHPSSSKRSQNIRDRISADQ